MKKFISLFILSITLMFIGCGGVDSESSNNSLNNSSKTLTGYVIDDPVVDATIEVYDENGNLLAKKENATDKDGKFSINVKNTPKYLLKVYNGKINGINFNSELYSICFEDNCNVTPITTIIALNFANTLRYATADELEEYAQNVLGINDYQSVDLESIKNIREYLKNNNQSLDYLIGVIRSDLRDGYADNDLTTQIFPNAKKRAIITKTFQIDTNDIDNYQNRDLKIVNLLTGEKADINQPIAYKDFGLNVALVEDYNYTLYDGTEKNASSIIYLPFKAYSENKLDINSTLYYYIFLDPNLVNLPDSSKKALISVINTKYKNEIDSLRTIYKNYINYGDIYKTKLMSEISFLQTELIKNELTNFSTNTIQNSNQPSKIVAKIINSSAKTIDNKNYINFGGLSVSYNYTTNKFTFKNILPKYYGLTSSDVYQSNIKFYNQALSLQGILNSYNDNLVNANPGGLVGIAVSNVFSLISKHVGGEKTPMLCEAFDGNICQQNYLEPNFKNSYILYSNLKFSSVQGLLNGLDIVKSIIPCSVNVKYIKEAIDDLKNIDKKIQNAFDALKTLLDVTEVFLDFADIYSHFNNSFQKKFQDNINALKNLKGNIEETISKFKDLWEYANIDINSIPNKKDDNLKNFFIKLFGVYSNNYLIKMSNLPLLSNEEVTDKFGFSKLKNSGINKSIFLFSFVYANFVDERFYNENILNRKFKYRIYPDKDIQTYIGTLMTILYYSWGDKDVCKNCIKTTINSLIDRGLIIVPKKQKINYYRLLNSIKDHYFFSGIKYVVLSLNSL